MSLLEGQNFHRALVQQMQLNGLGLNVVIFILPFWVFTSGEFVFDI